MADAEFESKRKAAIELANAYREMMGMFGFKHLRGVVFERIKNDANKSVDSMDIADLTVAHVAEARGIRKAFDHIESELSWILQEHDPISRK